jgi:hypothetical protein
MEAIALRGDIPVVEQQPDAVAVVRKAMKEPVKRADELALIYRTWLGVRGHQAKLQFSGLYLPASACTCTDPSDVSITSRVDSGRAALRRPV